MAAAGSKQSWTAKESRRDYAYDDLDRRFATTRNGISIIETFDAADRTWVRTRQGTDGTQMVLQRNTYDLAGRLLATSDARGGRKTYSYQTDEAGQRTVTTMFSDGGQKVETYGRDGRLLKVTGNAVAPIRYDYGVEADNGLNRAFTKSIKLDAAFQDTPEWSKTYIDGAGRSFKTVFPDGAMRQSLYNGRGQLVKEIDSVGVTRLHLYNGKGEREYSAIDMNGDGQLNLDGTDRVTRNVSEYSQRDGLTVRRTSTYVWSEAAKDSSQLISSQETSLNGQRYTLNWHTRNGLTVQSRTTLLGQGVRLVSEIEPDGSLALTARQNSRLMSVTRQDSTGARISQVSYGYDPHGRIIQVTDGRNGTTAYELDSGDKVVRITTPSPAKGQPPQVTTIQYNLFGRPSKITYPDGASVQKEYYSNGKLKMQHGARTYPAEYSYDAQGRIQAMTGYADYANRKGSAVVWWNYDSQRGWLTSKVADDGTGTQYQYYIPLRKGEARISGRGIVTTYVYTSAGELSSLAYSDGRTPAVAYEYDRLGRQVKIIQGGTTTTRAYYKATQILSESYAGGPLYGLSLNYTYDTLSRRVTFQACQMPHEAVTALGNPGPSPLRTPSGLPHRHS